MLVLPGLGDWDAVVRVRLLLDKVALDKDWKSFVGVNIDLCDLGRPAAARQANFPPHQATADK